MHTKNINIWFGKMQIYAIKRIFTCLYCIQLNYHIVHIGFSKFLETIVAKKAYFKERAAEDFMRGIFNDANAIFFFLNFLYKSI